MKIAVLLCLVVSSTLGDETFSVLAPVKPGGCPIVQIKAGVRLACTDNPTRDCSADDQCPGEFKCCPGLCFPYCQRPVAQLVQPAQSVAQQVLSPIDVGTHSFPLVSTVTIPVVSPTIKIAIPSQVDIEATKLGSKFVSLQDVGQLGLSGLQPAQISPNVIVDNPRQADLGPVVSHQVVKRIEAVPITRNVGIQGSSSASASASAGPVSASAAATPLEVGANALPSASLVNIIDIQTSVNDALGLASAKRAAVAARVSAINRQRLQTLRRESALASAVTNQRLQDVQKQIRRTRLRDVLANDVRILGNCPAVVSPFSVGTPCRYDDQCPYDHRCCPCANGKLVCKKCAVTNYRPRHLY